MGLRGAACAWQRSQTPSVSSAVTELASSVVVGLAVGGALRRMRMVGTPPAASATAAVNPAGPPPTTMASVLSGIKMMAPSIPYDPTSTGGLGIKRPDTRGGCNRLSSPRQDRNEPNARFLSPSSTHRRARRRPGAAEGDRGRLRGRAGGSGLADAPPAPPPPG